LDLELPPLYWQIGRTDQSVSRYENAIARGKGSNEVFNNDAWTLTESERLEEAEVVIALGLQRSPDCERERHSPIFRELLRRTTTSLFRMSNAAR
jgi:hypothetical protein